MQTKYVKLDDVIAILKANIQFNQQKKMKLEKAVIKVTGGSVSTITNRLILDTAIKESEALMETIVEKLPIYEVDINEKPFEENT